jgi:hypothetical protein
MQSENLTYNSIEDLISGMTNNPAGFEHLRIFMGHEPMDICNSNLEYLMVSPKGFGKARLLDLDVEDDIVIIEFLDCLTNEVRFSRIRVNDVNPKMLFINWQDIANMVLKDCNVKAKSEDLLEFDY